MSSIDLAAIVAFWVCVAGVAYAYLGYPLVALACAAVFGRRRLSESSDRSTGEPFVSVLIVAHNEEDAIAARVANALALDYSPDRLEIVIASDGSTDRTAALVASCADQRVRLVNYPFRRGKAAVMNDVVPTLAGDIVVLSDANTSMAPNVVRNVIRRFRDPDVGVVVGRLVLIDPLTGRNVDSLYWRYETFVKRLDARLDALLGANGGIYAIRRALFTPIPRNTLIDDLVLPLLLRLRTSCRIAYDPSVVAREETAPDVGSEFARRRRIGAGAFQSLGVLWPLLSPARGWIAFAFLSHKVMRWLCPFLIVAGFGLNLVLAVHPLYAMMLAGHAAFFTGAAIGAIVPGTGRLARLLRLAAMFVSMNAALLAGFCDWALGTTVGSWDRTRRRAASLATAPAPDRPIRVVHLVIALEIGGLEMVVANLARQLGRRYQLHVICLEGLGPIAGRFEHSGVAVECIGDKTTPIARSVITLRRRLKTLRPDVVHTHNEKAHIRGAIATLGLRRAPALVHTRHGESRATGLAGIANRLALRRSRAVVGVSEGTRAITCAEGAPSTRVRVIRNGVAIHGERANGTDDRRGSRVVAISRLSPVKDLPTLLRAARIVADIDSSFQLDIVGDGPLRTGLETLRDELGLRRRITFHGASDDVGSILAGAHLFVQSSLSEGMPLTVLEAMAAGVPVVATRVGGTPEIVVHGVTGLLVEPERPEALAAAMLTLLTNPTMARHMGRAARRRAEGCFNLRDMAASYESLYDEVMARRRVQAA